MAEQRGLLLGTAADGRALAAEEEYRRILAREFGMITAENAMKWGRLVREPNVYNFTEADRLVEFARGNAMAIRGHTFVWHRQTPAWLTEEAFSAEEIRELLRDHILTLGRHYRGQIRSWDVVNEAIDDDAGLRDTVFLRAMGEDYIARAFEWAHHADPDARLFYNDYGAEGLGPKSDAVYELVQRLVADGIPIHGVGLQMHLALDAHPPLPDIRENIRRLNDLGLEVSITELDIRIPNPVTPEKRERQARLYGEILRLALEAENVREFVLWGFTDRHSWIPRRFPETEEGLIFDREYRPKPAYSTLRKALEEGAD